MPNTLTVTTVFIALLFSNVVHAQDKMNVKFGKVSTSDFNLPSSRYDTSAEAVIITDVGYSSFEGNNKGSFSLRFEHKQRIKILKQSGMDAATFEIPLYVGNAGREEDVENLKAITYNLNGSEVVQTKLNSSQVFKEKVNKYWVNKKFTMPAVQVGSIIEVSYIINSEYLFNLRSWTFQGEYPRLWSEYEVRIPEYFNYVFLAQGYENFYEKKNSFSSESYRVSDGRGVERADIYTFTGRLNINKWVMKDVPTLKTESYTSTLRNHISKIEFQLSSIQYPNSGLENIMGDWNKMGEKYMLDEDFGLAISKANNWLDNDLKILSAGTNNNLEKSRKIFYYVKDNFKNTGESSLRLSNNLKSVFEKKSGSQAELNLLLIAMLLHEKIDAKPVILSTRNHGYTSEFYPLIERFNYLVADVQIDNKEYYLDASDENVGFNRLSDDCYNGHARVVSRNPIPVYFLSDSLKETKKTMIIIDSDEKAGLDGGFRSDLGYYESLNLRNTIKKDGKDDFFKKIKAGYSMDMELSNSIIDSLKLLEQPCTVKYDFKLSDWEDDVIYLNPMFSERYKENPFVSAERKYPVEMPYAFDETYVLLMDVPKGYTIDEMPKSTKVKFNEDEGYFEYIIDKDANQLRLRSRLYFNKATFMPEDYQSLRDFFAHVVKKQNEQVVFKKQ